MYIRYVAGKYFDNISGSDYNFPKTSLKLTNKQIDKDNSLLFFVAVYASHRHDFLRCQ